MSYEEIQHTADRALRVRAADLPGLFAESARGMNTLAGIRLAPGPRVRRTYETTAPDVESLLVAFLSELVYLIEHEQMAFDEYSIRIEAEHIQVEMAGASIQSIDKAIKAVTYHKLQVRKTNQGYEVEIVFDV